MRRIEMARNKLSDNAFDDLLPKENVTEERTSEEITLEPESTKTNSE